MRVPFYLPNPVKSLASISHRGVRRSHRPTTDVRGEILLSASELTDQLGEPESFILQRSDAERGPQHETGILRTILPLQHASRPSQLSLPRCHKRLFETLSTNTDLLLLRVSQNPCMGYMAVEQLRCLEAAWNLILYYQADVQRVIGLPPSHRHLLHHLRLVYFVTSKSPNALLFVSKELQRATALPNCVLSTLLAIPCAPDVLRLILTSQLSKPGAAIDASLFQSCSHALLSNDNFFKPNTFMEMHRLMVDVLLPSLRAAIAEGTFDYVAVRWTPLMNKWSRVYAKAAKGFCLRDCLDALLLAVPAVEMKLPASFYVRLLGALLDTAATEVNELHARKGWGAMQMVADDALRIFGRNTADVRAVWILLLKGALILPPAREDHRRLLSAYHLCARRGCVLTVDRKAFQQVVRLVSTAIHGLPLSETTQVVEELCRFLYEQASISFLWLLDGVGSVLTTLWECHGLAAQGDASQLVHALETLLRERRVSGVELGGIPIIARALDHFQIGNAVAFWWTCGCGETLPSISKRCTACLRRASASWACSHCSTKHKTPCLTQSCACGHTNPRQFAASAAKISLCNKCGVITDAEGVCVCCKQQSQDAEATVRCAGCGEVYGANALYCPHCYTPRPGKELHLWHCEECGDFNYSIWSSCHACRTPRKTGAFCMPFNSWRCACGAVRHPCRLGCGDCAVDHTRSVYTCAGCSSSVPLHALQRVTLKLEGKPLSLHACPHCSQLHPRDDLVLRSPFLTRHCMRCAKAVKNRSISATGVFHHCGVVQCVNEHYVFRCRHCNHTELQIGYDCQYCRFPRPELEALLNDTEDQSKSAGYVWRCLRETEEGLLCGRWNYSWSSSCVTCGTGRPDSAFECRAKAHLWVCETCNKPNRPIDVLFCPHCPSGLQPVQVCATCGLPHLSYSCRVQL